MTGEATPSAREPIAGGEVGYVAVHRLELAGPVLNRVLATAAAHAELPLDRVGDVLLLGDELVARAPATADGSLRVSLRVEPGRLDVRVGPLADGSAEQVLKGADVAGLGNVLGRLADESRAESGADGDALVFVVSAG
jgi:hypothetical protein